MRRLMLFLVLAFAPPTAIAGTEGGPGHPAALGLRRPRPGRGARAGAPCRRPIGRPRPHPAPRGGISGRGHGDAPPRDLRGTLDPGPAAAPRHGAAPRPGRRPAGPAGARPRRLRLGHDEARKCRPASRLCRRCAAFGDGLRAGAALAARDVDQIRPRFPRPRRRSRHRAGCRSAKRRRRADNPFHRRYSADHRRHDLLALGREAGARRRPGELSRNLGGRRRRLEGGLRGRAVLGCRRHRGADARDRDLERHDGRRRGGDGDGAGRPLRHPDLGRRQTRGPGRLPGAGRLRQRSAPRPGADSARARLPLRIVVAGREDGDARRRGRRHQPDRGRADHRQRARADARCRRLRLERCDTRGSAPALPRQRQPLSRRPRRRGRAARPRHRGLGHHPRRDRPAGLERAGDEPGEFDRRAGRRPRRLGGRRGRRGRPQDHQHLPRRARAG